MSATLFQQRPGYGPPTPVEIFQWQAEFDPLLDLYRERAPKKVLEIGTYHGGTLYHWLQNANEGTHVVSVDSYAVGVDNRALYAEWVPDEVELTVIDADSRDAKTVREVGKHGPFDWCFIDAGHYYEEVRDDWENYRPFCSKGAIVAFHDILPPSRTWPSIEVAWLWKEIKRFGWETEEFISDPDAEWGGIGVVHIP
jgi:predicted O-methyltransferase YrrM